MALESWTGECALGQGVQDRSARFPPLISDAWVSLSPFLRQEFSLERSFRDNGVTKFIRNYFIRGGILFFENIFQVIKKVCFC